MRGEVWASVHSDRHTGSLRHPPRPLRSSLFEGWVRGIGNPIMCCKALSESPMSRRLHGRSSLGVRQQPKETRMSMRRASFKVRQASETATAFTHVGHFPDASTSIRHMNPKPTFHSQA